MTRGSLQYLAKTISSLDQLSRGRVEVGIGTGGGFLKGIERVAVAGRPADVAGQLADIAAAGAGLILLNPLFDEAEQMERLSAEVIPQLA